MNLKYCDFWMQANYYMNKRTNHCYIRLSPASKYARGVFLVCTNEATREAAIWRALVLYNIHCTQQLSEPMNIFSSTTIWSRSNLIFVSSPRLFLREAVSPPAHCHITPSPPCWDFWRVFEVRVQNQAFGYIWFQMNWSGLFRNWNLRIPLYVQQTTPSND
ncbi:Hypothetical_protein [Hexamita inflata]|uniref:Hypothetical_protein n=1 Tax=Hexamita inflata TaxID=28002 RepID=A0AA86QAU9_9EUKA|nr:Hypothetical protein HINF_LOCUS31838 [Hexamita inflata]CAI9949502.1 Hypothetical protein HINF_LOCUS37147 [Hexamita inflata]CAI9949507.1 Hypothetical protein HINF_LOCUS37152 [Hexamita inflata]CAI9963516.1 Hypothetical protein HINF_LOCUS51161 [Hexamita inflata]